METYAAIRLCIDNWRWAGVPVYVRAGKQLPVTCTEVLVHFKRPPRETFGEAVPSGSCHMRMRISPDIVIALGLRIKAAGDRMTGEDVELTVTSRGGAHSSPYERLLGDALEGRQELFASEDGVKASWRIVDPVLGDVTPVHMYDPGMWGPSEAERLLGDDGPWINPAAVSRAPEE